MTISEEHFNHGYIISQIMLEISKINNLSMSIEKALSRTGYIVHIKAGQRTIDFGLLIKCSKKRRSPWRYTFTRDHQTEIDILQDAVQKVFVVLVNKDDGVVCLTYSMLKEILDDHHEDTEWVSVQSKLGSQYTVQGKDGKLREKISRKDFPRIFHSYVETLLPIQ
jgi:hypothetical protein